MNYPPIFETCAADVAVVALIGESGGVLRLYPAGAAPQGVTKPYAVWQSVSGGPENYLAGRPDIDRVALQVDAYAETLTAARALADAIEDAVELTAHVTAFNGEEKDQETALYRVGFSLEWFIDRAVVVPVVSSSDTPAPVSSSNTPGPTCPYPLDDDGTLATGLGYVYAGPAVAPYLQGMDYTAATTTGNTAVLAPAALFSSARVPRPASAFLVVEAEITVAVGAAGGQLVAVVSDAGGAFINAASLVGGAGQTGIGAIKVEADGAVTGYYSQVPGSLTWTNPLGQTFVGPTDKVGFAVAATDNTQAGERVAIRLRTDAADLLGNWAGGFTLCGDPI